VDPGDDVEPALELGDLERVVDSCWCTLFGK
jgi:hypothetical protein